MRNGQLKSIIERIENLEEEKRGIASSIKDVYSEAKSSGCDCKILRKVVALRRELPEKRAEDEAVLDLYMSELGMV